MNPIEQELQNFRTKLDLERSKPEDEQSITQINFYTKTIADLELQLKTQGQAQEVREQKQAEQLDSLGQQIQDMDLLGAILPQDQLQSTNIGLTEWNEMRQSLNQILHAWATDIQQATHTAHNVEVDKLQAELRDAKAQNAGHQEQILQLQRQNGELQKDVADLTGELNESHDEISDLKMQLREASDASFKYGEANNRAQDEIEALKSQLAEAAKPKASTQPSQSVQEQLEGLRKKSAESWAEKANRGLARFNLPLLQTPELPTLPAQEDNPNGNTFPVAQDDQLPAAETVENVGNSFREEDTVHTGQREVDGDGSAQEAMERATEERIADLEARVNKLEFMVIPQNTEVVV